jgi:hypothetical protein
MHRFLSYLVVAALTAPLAGCFVASRSPSRTAYRSCPPSEHWEDGACRHNGRALGHYKHDDDDDDQGHGHHHGHD